MNKKYKSKEDLITSIKKDVYRYTKSNNIFFILGIAFHNPGLIFSFLYRVERRLLFGSLPLYLIGKFFYPLYFFITYYLLDYHIEPSTKIGSGLLLHNKGIVITEKAQLGENISIMDNVTIGVNFGIDKTDFFIGNNVKIGSGAKIIAKQQLHIADGIIIGANAVVVRSLTKKKGVYVGIPAVLKK